MLCPAAERSIGESECMLDVLQRWGHQRAEVRFFLRHERAPGRDVGKDLPLLLLLGQPEGPLCVFCN